MFSPENGKPPASAGALQSLALGQRGGELLDQVRHTGLL